MPNYLVTGGAGFVGSHLAERLLAGGNHVTALDNLSSGSRENIAHLFDHPRFRFVQADVNARKVLDPAVAGADIVFHLAATVGVFNIVKSPVETIANNVNGTEAVLEAAVANKTKVIVASTSEVYGKSAQAPFREEDDLVLGPTIKSRWSYAASKIVDEFLALAYLREFSVPTVVVRLFNTIGPRQSGDYGMVVPRFIRRAVAGEPLQVFGTGQQVRAFTDVSDIVAWLERLGTNPRAEGEVVNLGNTQEISIAQLAERVISITGSRSRIEFVPYAQAYGEGFEDIDRRVPDISKAIALTGYAPQSTLDQSLERIHAWCLQSTLA